jgi:hypothetical protein
MHKTLTLVTMAMLLPAAMAGAAMVDFGDLPAGQSDTDNPLVYEVEVDGEMLDVIVEATVTFADWRTTNNGPSGDKDGILGYSDGDSWNNWIDDRSPAAGDPNPPETETVVINFRRQSDSAMVPVDLGPNGLRLYLNLGQYQVNGTVGGTTGVWNVVAGNETNVEALVCTVPGDELDNDAYGLRDLDIAAIVPEPASLGLLALGGLAILRRRR